MDAADARGGVMSVFLFRLIGVFRRREAELDEEIQTHLDHWSRDHIAAHYDLTNLTPRESGQSSPALGRDLIPRAE